MEIDKPRERLKIAYINLQSIWNTLNLMQCLILKKGSDILLATWLKGKELTSFSWMAWLLSISADMKEKEAFLYEKINKEKYKN